MKKFFNTSLGRLRLTGYAEGISLLVLVFVAVPLKYSGVTPQLSQIMGPIHGILFLLFVINTFRVAVEQQWKFKQVTWKILLACFIPFGTFYIDYKFLRPIHTTN
jgi:integral membrane protein